MSIVEICQSIHLDILTAVAWMLNDTIIYGFIILALVLTGEKRKEKRNIILFSLVIAALAGIAIKEVLFVERPCAGEEWCPGGHSFPSMHALTAFVLMAASIRKRTFPLYLLFALFICFTRLYLGVHVFQDIAAALPIAVVSYYVTNNVMKNGKRN